MPRRPVLLIHGIASRGDWHETVADALEPHFRCVFVKYPQYVHLGWLKVPSLSWFLAVPVAAGLLAEIWGVGPGRYAWAGLLVGLVIVGALESMRRRSALACFRRVYDGVARLGEVPHLVAHSLGTYLSGRLLQLPYVRFGRIVFVGSPLPRRFWVGRLDPRQVSAVRNEVGRKDAVVLLVGVVSRFLPGFGSAGWAGFEGPEDHVHSLSADGQHCAACETKQLADPLVHNASVAEFTHSDAFIGTGYAETYWLPFLWDLPGHELVDFHAACATAVRLEEEENWPELEKHETALRQRQWRLWGIGPELPMSLEGYVRHYARCRALALQRTIDAATLERVTARAVHLTWWAVTNARAERAKPVGEREEAVVLAMNPVQAARKAVTAVFP